MARQSEGGWSDIHPFRLSDRYREVQEMDETTSITNNTMHFSITLHSSLNAVENIDPAHSYDHQPPLLCFTSRASIYTYMNSLIIIID